jgi:hypothetical protein
MLELSQSTELLSVTVVATCLDQRWLTNWIASAQLKLLESREAFHEELQSSWPTLEAKGDSAEVNRQ